MKYEIAVTREVLREKGAELLGRLSAYENEHDIVLEDELNPINIFHKLLWNLKEDVLKVEDEDLQELNHQFNFVMMYLDELEEADMKG